MGPDAPIDLAGVGAAIRRDGRWIIAIALLLSGIVLAVSLASAPRYHADARLADDPLTADSLDSSAADRRLATSRELVTTPAVLGAAATRVPGETADSLAAKVSASIDPAASILDITATDTDARRTAAIANAVAGSFLEQSDAAQRRALAQAQERLSSELDAQRRRGASTETIDALRAQLGDIAAAGVMQSAGLRLVEEATAPEQPYAPRPLRSAVLALLAALLVGVVIAVVRDRLRRRRPDARALSDLLNVPLIAALPVTGPRHRAGGAAIDGGVVEEAVLQAAVRGALPPRRQRIVLVHGVGAHAKASAVASALARSLSWSGYRTLLLRIGDPGAPAPSDIPVEYTADVEERLQALKDSDYRYVVVESPETINGRRLRRVASDAAGAILVARLGVSGVDDAVAARRLMDALGLNVVGLVVTASATEAAEILRDGVASPVRQRTRGRTAAANGSHAPESAGRPAEAGGRRA